VILEEGAEEEGSSISGFESSAMTKALLWRDNSIVNFIAIPSPERCILEEVLKRLIELLTIIILFRLF